MNSLSLLSVSSLATDECHTKWAPWTCFKRLDYLSREIRNIHYQEEKDKVEMDPEVFQLGMAMEAVRFLTVDRAQVAHTVSRHISPAS